MPGKIKVKVLAGRNLPVMDRASDTTDAFVEIKFGGVTHKTDVCRKSLNPHWSSTEWYRFEVDESELQDEPLQLRLMDHDTYSANDAIGKVVISLAPLLAREANNIKGTAGPPGGAVMSGWIPVFDTMHGIRGELHVIVKVELFSDFNKYKTSSCGVQFFHCPMIPPGYRATSIHGFVEELIVNDDPEYQWIDKIRTPRASNEARQVAFIKLSNQVQRLVGLKAAELGANAVVGYQQDFDLEGEAGVVARAIGTAVSITPLPLPSQPASVPSYTQQQLKKYLDILVTDDENITDLNLYYQNHQEELHKLLSILHPSTAFLLDEPDTVDEDEKSYDLPRQSSIKSYVGDVSIFQDEYVSQKSLKHLTEDQMDLNRLLNRTDESDSDSPGPLKSIKKMKKHFFTKRFGKRRASRKSEVQDGSELRDDQVSIRSNSSDISRISMAEIRNEFRKLKRLKAPKIRKVTNSEDEGIAMASILGRSVIHAHTSLACITESQDSEHSPASTRHISESEPTVNVFDDNNAKTEHAERREPSEKELKINIPEIHTSSLENIKSDEAKPAAERKISESCPTTPMVVRSDNLLKLPDQGDSYGSVSSILSADSSEMYSSSDEEDESCEQSGDNDQRQQSVETTSSLVQSVLSHDVDPKFIAQMEKKLTDLEIANTEHEHGDTKVDDLNKVTNIKVDIQSPDMRILEHHDYKKEMEESSSRVEASTSTTDIDKCVKSNNHHHFIKINNPFAPKKSESFSAPSSPIEKKGFVYRSSKRIKRQLSKISKSSMIKSLSHYSLLPGKKHVDPKPPMSQPGSASDVTSSKAPSETVLGSPFLSYTDLLSLDKEGFHPNTRLHKSDELDVAKVSMYIGSEPVSRTSFSGPSSHNGKDDRHHDQKIHKKEKCALKPTGLVHTAMENILMDTVQSLLIPTSPEPVKSNDRKFFDDVNEKLEKVEEARNKEISDNAAKMADKKEKKLIRQDSVHSNAAPVESRKMSEQLDPNFVNVIPCKLTPNTPVLQHFHPILSGAPNLESIPSLPESSLDAQSLDVEGVEDRAAGTNSASVCGNSHAACGVDRGERERDRGEKEKSEKEKGEKEKGEKGSPRHARHESYGGREPVPSGTPAVQNASLNSSSTPLGIHRRSSDSDLSVTPKGGSLNASAGNTGGAILRPSMNSNNLEMLEYPFLTMTEYPPGFIVHIGGTVCARSVKLVDGGGESAARAAWWAELRTELRAHARALRCSAVLAYCERAAVREDVIVLSASGTAAVINLDCDFTSEEAPNTAWNGATSATSATSVTSALEEAEAEAEAESCSAAHVPYSPGAGPYRAELAVCAHCRRARVPTVLLATCAKPSRLVSHAKAVTLTAVAARARRAPPAAEPGARDLSDQLPFLEYELHKLLLAKLRMQGANALFNVQTQVAIGERCVVALASGTAVRLAALPPPTPPRIKASENDKEALEMQKALFDTFSANKAANGYDVGVAEHCWSGAPAAEAEERPALELAADKDACVLELDEAEDVETAKALAVRRSNMQVFTAGLRPAPGAPPHAFTQVWRARLSSSGAGSGAERLTARALLGAAYKLRRLQPAALTPPAFHLDLPEDEIQLIVSGTAIPLADGAQPACTNGSSGSHARAAADQEDDIFALDEEQLTKPLEPPEDNDANGLANSAQPAAGRVALTTLGYVGGARASRRLCALRLLFVRETTAVRELGGLSGFLHTFTCEVLAIARAYTAALGGNALTSFYITQLMLQDNAHKNQSQCLLAVGGDVVHVTY